MRVKLPYLLTLTLLNTVMVAGTPACFADDQIKPVVETIVVDEPQALVFEAIRCLRATDKEHRKLESYKDHQAVIQEQFGGLPVIGESTCTYKETEAPPNRIDYSLISSNRFKMFEGAWVLTPQGEGKTKVTLSSSLDPGLRVPFWKELSHTVMVKHLRKRLGELECEARKLANEQALAHPINKDGLLLEATAGAAR